MKRFKKKEIYIAARESAQWLIALADLPVDTGLVPSIPYASSQQSVAIVLGDSDTLSTLSRYQAHIQCIHTHTYS